MLYFLLIMSHNRLITARYCITAKFTNTHLDGKIDKAQLSGVPIHVIFDSKYITGGIDLLLVGFK